MTEKKFNVAGVVTTPGGEMKTAFGTDLVTRTKMLIKSGFSISLLVELPEPMTKLDALRHLDAMKVEGDPGYVIAYKLAEKIKEAKKKQSTRTVKASATQIRSLEELKTAAAKSPASN